MRVDFYQLSRDPAELVVPLLARATKGAGERLLVVADAPDLLDKIDRALWECLPDAFLAHGKAGGPHDARQPVLLSQSCEATNGARYIAMADGQWRDEARRFDRAFLLFDDTTLQGARACWRRLGEDESVERKFWKQEDGRWREGP